MKTDKQEPFDLNEEQKLIEKCLSRDRALWEIFVKKYTKLVYYVIQNINRARSASFIPEEIDDLHNDVFLALLEKKLGQYEGRQDCSLASWIKIVTVSITLNYLKSKQVRARYAGTIDSTDDEGMPMNIEYQDPSSGPEDEVMVKDTLSVLDGCITELPPREKLFLKLFYDKELPLDEIAKMMNLSSDTLYVLKYRVLKKLKNSIESMENNHY